jgi:predicted nucleotidyltransferase
MASPRLIVSPERSAMTDRTSEGELANLVARAKARARDALAMLAERGVEAKVVGSLAKGRFHEGSDIDFLVTTCPAHLRHRIEGLVEDTLEGFAFDVLYLDEIPARRIARFTAGAIGTGDLR